LVGYSKSEMYYYQINKITNQIKSNQIKSNQINFNFKNSNTMKRSIYFGFLALALSLTLTIGCKEDENQAVTANDETSVAQDDYAANDSYDDADDIANNAANSKFGLKSASIDSTIPSCATITVEKSDVLLKKLVIDFGSGCTSANGIERKGKILVTLTGQKGGVGAYRTVTFENYYRNGVKIEGTRVVKYLGAIDGKPTDSVIVTGGKLTRTDGTTRTWTSARKRVWSAGFATPLKFADDVYEISGTTSGINSKGLVYTTKTISPLVIKATCGYITSGILEHTVGLKKFTLDYGAGDCDNQAVVTIEDKTVTITLGRN